MTNHQKLLIIQEFVQHIDRSRAQSELANIYMLERPRGKVMSANPSWQWKGKREKGEYKRRRTISHVSNDTKREVG